VGEDEDIPLFFKLIPVLALLSNYDRENCLINLGTEGGARERNSPPVLAKTDPGGPKLGAMAFPR
jgi:hypothetical protein